MPKKEDLPAEAASLEVLEKVLEERRWSHLEKIAKGLTHEEYLKHCGRAQEDLWLIEEVANRLKTLRAGDDA